MLNHDRLQQEVEGEYHPVFVELKKLEREHPLVNRNQDLLTDADDSRINLVNTYAALLHACQEETENPRSPLEIRQSLEALAGIPGFRDLLSDLVGQLVPSTVFVIEQVYFQNRRVDRYFKLPQAERSDKLRTVELDEWVYPLWRIDKLRDLVRRIWRDDVLKTA